MMKKSKDSKASSSGIKISPKFVKLSDEDLEDIRILYIKGVPLSVISQMKLIPLEQAQEISREVPLSDRETQNREKHCDRFLLTTHQSSVMIKQETQELYARMSQKVGRQVASVITKGMDMVEGYVEDVSSGCGIQDGKEATDLLNVMDKVLSIDDKIKKKIDESQLDIVQELLLEGGKSSQQTKKEFVQGTVVDVDGNIILDKGKRQAVTIVKEESADRAFNI